MDLKRSAAIVAGCGALAVWLAGAATSGPRQSTSPIAIRPYAIEERGHELASEVARLRDRLRPTTPPLQSRDLFHYSPRKSASPARAVRPQPQALLDVSVRAAAVPPSAFTLLGIAEEDGTGGPVRTAIISAAGALLHVKIGDTVGDRYRVAAISGESVDMTATSDGADLRLSLK